MSVSNTCLAYNSMACKWDLIHALLGGTEAMRCAGAAYLPKHKRESVQDFTNRLNRSFLYEALSDTVRGISSKPFAESVTLAGDLPERLAAMVKDVDGLGSDLTQFARACFEDGVKYGLGHILVDYPTVSEEVTLDKEKKILPNFVQVSPPNLIGWKHEDGSLVSIRVKEVRIEESEDYEQTEVTYIRVYTRTDWKLYRCVGNEEVLEKSGNHTFGRVPLVTFYFSIPKGPLQAEPPFMDLAWKNLEHWQSASDQSNILHFARCGILFGKGFTGEEQKSVIISPNTIVYATSKDASLEHVEHTGTAIKSGQDHLDHLEAQMEVLGLRPLVERSSDSTATGKQIDENRTETEIQAWIRALSNALNSAFVFAAIWTGETLPEDLKVQIFDDFAVGGKGSDIDSLIAMRKTIPPLITHETFINECKRRGTLQEGVRAELEIEGIQAEMMVVSESNDDGTDDPALDLP